MFSVHFLPSTQFRRLRHGVEVRFPNKCSIVPKPQKETKDDTVFEVYVNGELIHSKKNGDGFIDALTKSMKIFDRIAEILGMELPSKTAPILKKITPEEETASTS
ncbi:hypothetical protein Ciccas_011586 [Cichlidogyrus casuarinus]|uniref:Selenoprotein W n=1 Tax=Cichlidogyrus casuarinus TaxID=1844966 RepID=A0ABD2PQU4_9PLAT